ncbi:cell division protein SepF [Candidatus Woesearchaeota archaeon]|nr:cell division protein SepF [Candidatus Woesearchaeota archaeon]
MSIFSKLFGKGERVERSQALSEEDYLELDSDVEKKNRSKVLVKPFVIREFGDIKDAIDSLREGYTITLINIKPLKDKDLVELKRTISKLKKVCDAIEGDIAGFGDDWIVATPSFAEVFRAMNARPANVPQERNQVRDEDF